MPAPSAWSSRFRCWCGSSPPRSITHQADRRQALKATLLIASVVGAFGMTAGRAGCRARSRSCWPIRGRGGGVFAGAVADRRLCADRAAARGRAYGPVRLWGSVAFIAGNVGAGLLLEVIAPGHLIWLIVGSLAAAVVAAAGAGAARAGARRRPPAGAAGFAEVAAAQSGVSRGGAGLEPGAGQPRALLRLLDPGMARRGLRRHRDRAALGHRRGGRDRAVRAVRAAAGGACARPRCWRSAASARSCAGRAMAFDPPVGAAAGAAAPARRLVRRGASRHDGVSGARGAARTRRDRAGLVATWSGIVNASATFASGFVYAASGSLAYLLMAAMALIGLCERALCRARLSVGRGTVSRSERRR